MLYEFILLHRDDIIRRCKVKVASRPVSKATPAEIEHGVPVFLDQLVSALRLGHAGGIEISQSAILHGQDLLAQGLTVSQVVHDYGDVCQAITELAVEINAPIGTDDFRLLNGCLDEAIASAVTEYGRERTPAQAPVSEANVDESGQLGFLAYELQALIDTAILAFDVLKTGHVGVAGSTGKIVDRALLRSRGLISRSLSEARLKRGIVHLEEFRVGELIGELADAGRSEAKARGIRVALRQDGDGAGTVINADRQLLTTAVMTLVLNALNFTRPDTAVTLGVHAVADRVLIDVGDECGGIQGSKLKRMFHPFEPQSANRERLHTGLTFAQQAIEAIGGRISVRNAAAIGCVFTVDLPRVPVPASRVELKLTAGAPHN